MLSGCLTLWTSRFSLIVSGAYLWIALVAFAREREVLAEVGAGRSNAEIACELHMSPATARTHVSRLLTKLDARDRSQLVSLAYETGLLTPGQL